MDQILFYISQYWSYSLVFLFALLSLVLLLKSPLFSGRQDKPQLFVATAILLYLILFTGFVGSAVRPYFTNFSKISQNGYYFGGTGSFVSSNIVMTNAHVVSHCKKKLAVSDAKKDFYKARVIAVLPENKGDVAFLQTDAKRKKFALFSADLPKVGDIAIFPNYTENVGKFNIAQGKLIEIKEREMRFLAPKGRQGNSGSPVFNKKGYLIGILWGGGGFLTTNTVVTNAKTILNFARESNVTLYSIKDQKRDLAENPEFFAETVVNILCSRD